MNLKRRDFLKCSASFLAAAAFLPEQIFSRDAFDDPNNQLQMLILGDSVMWGQGLLDEEKFWFLTKKWLEKETGRTVVHRLEAHSGATIFCLQRDGSFAQIKFDAAAFNCKARLSAQ